MVLSASLNSQTKIHRKLYDSLIRIDHDVRADFDQIEPPQLRDLVIVGSNRRGSLRWDGPILFENTEDRLG